MSWNGALLAQLMRAVGHGIAFAVPETWVGLLDASETEIIAPDYVRKRISPPGGISPVWTNVIGSAKGARLENADAVSWPPVANDWPEVAGVALFSAETGGLLLLSEPLPAPKLASAGEPFRIPPQAFKIGIGRF